MTERQAEVLIDLGRAGCCWTQLAAGLEKRGIAFETFGAFAHYLAPGIKALTAAGVPAGSVEQWAFDSIRSLVGGNAPLPLPSQGDSQ